tara:strand:- start:2702 stop:2911 length:210 start_codon:yes stop_codon:yes gene_type:complete
MIKILKVLPFIFLLQSNSLFSSDMFDSGAPGDINKQMNLMWRTFGHGEGITPLSPHESPFDHLTQKANS